MRKVFVSLAFAAAVMAMQSCASYTNSAAVKTMSSNLITNVEADMLPDLLLSQFHQRTARNKLRPHNFISAPRGTNCDPTILSAHRAEQIATPQFYQRTARNKLRPHNFISAPRGTDCGLTILSAE